MDRTEWGAYEPIIRWSKIYQINIYIYCYIMSTQTIDGDEFILDKECIRLLYCNKSKWGDTENHYDLLHPTVQQTCKTKSYSRRSESQQDEYQQQEGNNNTDGHRQTMIGEEQNKQVERQAADKLGPKEDASKMRLHI
eukprot:1298413-Heterocapsa_arctica.AAC.1